VRARVALFLFLLVCAACVKVGPDYVRPQTAVRENWLSTPVPGVTCAPGDYRSWWRVFDDPVLDRLIDLAYRQNLPLRVAAVRVLEARAQLGIAVGQLYPETQQAVGDLQYNRVSDHSSFSSFGGFPPYWQDQVGLNFGWEIDFWGKLRREVESADASLRASWPIMTAPWSASPPTWRRTTST
jgi:outer membrane protein TolC